jgi:hypothetical protein
MFTLYRRLGGLEGSFWTGAENLASTGIRSLDSETCSKSLYCYSLTKRLLTVWDRNVGFLKVR